MPSRVLLSTVALFLAFISSAYAIVYEEPQVYPSPNASGVGNWHNAFVQAQSLVGQMTTDEKFGLLMGTTGPCVGNIGAIPRLNFTGLCLQDGPLAIRQADYASAFPAGLATAASFDKSLMYQRGYDMGSEFKGKGANIALGPVCGPLGRNSLGGRNWEGFSPDPYLTGWAMTQTVSGMQDAGVQATAKHYIMNEQETQRTPSSLTSSDSYVVDIYSPTTIQAVSSNVDDRTIHELYLWPFADAVKAGTSAIMCSYNRVNETYSCQNSKILNGLLKDELGFQGYVMSDWLATHSIDGVNAGQDMDMPGSSYGTDSWNTSIAAYVANGSISESRLNDMATRVLTPYFYLGQDQNYPQIDPSEAALEGTTVQEWSYTFNFGGVENRDVRGDHASLIRSLGAQSATLLKNVNGALPLKAPRNIGVFGNDAADPVNGPYSFEEENIGTLPVGGGSGAARFTYVVSPFDAIKARARQDGALVQAILNNTLAAESLGTIIYPTPDVCLVFLKTFVTEGLDRISYEADWNSTAVVENVASSCNNTIVITHSGGINIMPWADNENVTAIIAAHLPGQESGNSIVDVLYGDVNPSGHLPFTIAYNASDYNTHIANFTGTNKTNAWQCNFTEGLYIDYRWFDYANITPRYEFGYGLSYTTFSMTNLSVTSIESNVSSQPAAQSGSTPPGGNADLWTTLLTVTVSVTNTGSVTGATVPQLYLAPPQSGVPSGTPLQVLRGFDKVSLQPSETTTVTFDLMRRDLSYWDIVSQQWLIPTGEFGINVGFSSRDIAVTGSATLI